MKKKTTWLHPRLFNMTVQARRERLQIYLARYDGPGINMTKGRRLQVARYQSEISFLETLDGVR